MNYRIAYILVMIILILASALNIYNYLSYRTLVTKSLNLTKSCLNGWEETLNKLEECEYSKQKPVFYEGGINFMPNYLKSYKEFKLTQIQEIASNVSDSNTYVLNVYDCTDFSKELVKRLHEINISSKCLRGYIRESKDTNIIAYHNWVEVNDSEVGVLEIEATNGQIIDNETYTNKYNVLSRTVCW